MKKAIVAIVAIMFVCGLAWAEDTGTQRVVEVKNEEGELSKCFIVADTAHCPLWGTIMGYEAKDYWADFAILRSRGINHVDMYINSGGGSAFAGMSIADTIRMAQVDGMEVDTFASGLVASAAVPIFLAGGQRTASINAMFMIHRGKLFKMYASETIEDLDAQREMMQLCEEQYISFLVQKTNLTADDIESKLDKTTWFSAEQAMEWGFTDVVK